jgi:polysaccharide pyruvyl transferase WcaK-like protein
VAAIAYEHKTLGIMEMLGLRSFAIRIEDVSEALPNLVRETWSSQDDLRRILPGRIEEARSRAATVTDHIRSVLEAERTKETVIQPEPTPSRATR